MAPETIGFHQGPADGEHAPAHNAPYSLTRGGETYVLTPGGVEGHDPDWHYCHRPSRGRAVTVTVDS